MRAAACAPVWIVRYFGLPTAIMTLLAQATNALARPWKHSTERGKIAGAHSGPRSTLTISGDRADMPTAAGVATIETILADCMNPLLTRSTSSLILARVGK